MDKQKSRWRIFQHQIASKSDRKIKARRESQNIKYLGRVKDVWYGGLVGSDSFFAQHWLGCLA